MRDWAKKEIEILKKQNGEDPYVNQCCDSAYKAYESLLKDGHSGFSIGITKKILMDLIDGNPLTAIEDDEDSWYEDCQFRLGYRLYIHKRKTSLFKYEYEDGKIKYSDLDRVLCVDINKPDVSYTSRTVRDIIDALYPIEMPYRPGGKIKVYCEDFLFHPENGDFDTIGIFYAELPNGRKVKINKFIYFTPTNRQEEIDKETYDFMKEHKAR